MILSIIDPYVLAVDRHNPTKSREPEKEVADKDDAINVLDWILDSTKFLHRVFAFRSFQPELPLQRGQGAAGRSKTLI